MLLKLDDAVSLKGSLKDTNVLYFIFVGGGDEGVVG